MMMNLVRARLPSIVIFTTLEAALIGFVAYRWREPRTITTPLKSAIPPAQLGAIRFRHSHGSVFAHTTS